MIELFWMFSLGLPALLGLIAGGVVVKSSRGPDGTGGIGRFGLCVIILVVGVLSSIGLVVMLNLSSGRSEAAAQFLLPFQALAVLLAALIGPFFLMKRKPSGKS